MCDMPIKEAGKNLSMIINRYKAIMDINRSFDYAKYNRRAIVG